MILCVTITILPGNDDASILLDATELTSPLLNTVFFNIIKNEKKGVITWNQTGWTKDFSRMMGEILKIEQLKHLLHFGKFTIKQFIVHIREISTGQHISLYIMFFVYYYSEVNF